MFCDTAGVAYTLAASCLIVEQLFLYISFCDFVESRSFCLLVLAYPEFETIDTDGQVEDTAKAVSVHPGQVNAA